MKRPSVPLLVAAAALVLVLVEGVLEPGSRAFDVGVVTACHGSNCQEASLPASPTVAVEVFDASSEG